MAFKKKKKIIPFDVCFHDLNFYSYVLKKKVCIHIVI